MRQGPDWTLHDNSLNMDLYYKDHLHLNENGNIKFSKLIIETLHDVLSPQSSQSSSSSSSSSYLSQSSLIRSPPPSSVPRSNLLSVQTPSQSSSSQSLSATATPFNPKHQKFLLNSPTAPPKSQTLTASPPFHQDFSSSLKTTSDHIPFELSLTCGVNVNYYKSVHHPIPTRENREHPGNFQNKSVSSAFN